MYILVLRRPKVEHNRFAKIKLRSISNGYRQKLPSKKVVATHISPAIFVCPPPTLSVCNYDEPTGNKILPQLFQLHFPDNMPGYLLLGSSAIGLSSTYGLFLSFTNFLFPWFHFLHRPKGLLGIQHISRQGISEGTLCRDQRMRIGGYEGERKEHFSQRRGAEGPDHTAV